MITCKLSEADIHDCLNTSKAHMEESCRREAIFAQSSKREYFHVYCTLREQSTESKHYFIIATHLAMCERSHCKYLRIFYGKNQLDLKALYYS